MHKLIHVLFLLLLVSSCTFTRTVLNKASCTIDNQCAGLTVYPVKLIIHAPLKNKNSFDIQRIIHYVEYACDTLKNSNIIIEDVIIVYDMPPTQISYNSKFENLKTFHDEATNNPIGIHIFIVDGIFDVHQENKKIIGMQHADYAYSCKNVIFITEETTKQTFVHELGHYFGLGHDENTNNIMYKNSSQRDQNAFFNTKQYIKMNTTAKFVVNYCIRNQSFET
jgi:hypothetical protein